VIWGGLHASYLCLERVVIWLWPAWLFPWRRFRLAGAMLLTFFLICVTWVFFRAPSIERAGSILHSMFTARIRRSQLDPYMLWLSLAVMFVVVMYQWAVRDKTAEQIWESIPQPLQALLVALAMFLILATPVQQKAFIYFQF
jgi:alginate O-acetyltransferase complex protein AlgI